MRHTHPFVESLWLVFRVSTNTQRPKSNGSSIGYRAGEISYRRHQILSAAFDRGILMMSPRSAKPAGRYPQLHQKCQLTTSHQRVLHQSSRPQGQLRPMSRQHRGHVLSCMMDGHLLCQCLWSFCNSPTRTLYSPVYSLSCSLHSLIRHLRHVHPRFVSI